MNTKEIQKLEQQLDNAREKIYKIRNKIEKLKLGNVREELVGKFISHAVFDDAEDLTYIHVYSVHIDHDDLVKIEGVGFYSIWTEYDDACSFKFDKMISTFISLRDFELQLNSGQLRIISRDEYIKAFKENVDRLNQEFIKELNTEHEN